jgi:hypothetical protein
MKIISFLFFLVIFHLNSIELYAQKPINEQYTNQTISNESDLWYIKKKIPKDTTTQKINYIKRDNVIKREKTIGPINIPEGLGSIVKWLFYGILIVGLVFLIMKGNFTLPGATNNAIEQNFTENTTIENANQLQKIGFEEQITKAETDGNYRLAIRLYYLWALKELVNRNLLHFHIKKTNQDYCQELSHNKHHTAFKIGTDYYNYTWFGEFPVELPIYEKIKLFFHEFIKAI